MGGWAQLNLVDVDLARGDVPSAQAALAKGRALLTGLQDVASLALHSRAEACLAHHQGRWDDALRSARSTIQTIGTAMPTAYYLAEAYLVAAEILAAGARAGQAVSHPELRRVARRLDRMSGNFRNVRERAQSLSHGLRRWPPHGTV